MPKINVYLSDELADAVKEANLPVSAICQRALEQAVRRVGSVRETGGAGESPFGRFTGRAKTVIVLATDEARTDGRQIDTGHLLSALLADQDSLAAKIIISMDAQPQDIAEALAAQRPPSGDPINSDPTYADDAREALKQTVTESLSLGHNYIGTEHILLGLIAEPDGTAGQILRAHGLDLRTTRKSVAAALSAFTHVSQSRQEVGAGGDMVARLTAAVRQQLAPIVDRLDRLEQRLDG